MHRAVVPCALAISLLIAAWAQSTIQVTEVPGQPRGAALDPAAKSVYLAMYDRNEVWRVDMASREALAKAPVGKGPASLALSPDGALLACVNRLASTLTLLKTSDLSPVATVPCGNGATSVTALGGRPVCRRKRIRGYGHHRLYQ